MKNYEGLAWPGFAAGSSAGRGVAGRAARGPKRVGAGSGGRRGCGSWSPLERCPPLRRSPQTDTGGRAATRAVRSGRFIAATIVAGGPDALAYAIVNGVADPVSCSSPCLRVYGHNRRAFAGAPGPARDAAALALHRRGRS